uniref:Immunoglobulin subtype domain-containing protein n=1 Tax=Poecilia formosa TaxID=48698 RepID=A0A096LQ31_POEFO
MVENGFTKPLGLVLIVTAHMVFYDPSHADVIGIVGQNISLHFKFNKTITDKSHIIVYKCPDKEIKISEYPYYKNEFKIYPEDSSIHFHITNLSLNHSETYWAILVIDLITTLSKNKVKLIVQEDNLTTTVAPTVPPETSTFTKTSSNGSSSFFSSQIVTVIVVSPFLLLAALLPFLVICLPKTKDQTQEGPQRSSTPTTQETVEVSVSTTDQSLVYSVLDFPKRPSSAVELGSNETEYATVSYLPEKKLR